MQPQLQATNSFLNNKFFEAMSIFGYNKLALGYYSHFLLTTPYFYNDSSKVNSESSKLNHKME